MRLPLIDAEEIPAEAITEGPLAPPFPGGCRVLIVEDNRDAGDSLALILRREGMDAQIATDREPTCWRGRLDVVKDRHGSRGNCLPVTRPAAGEGGRHLV